MRGVLNKPNKSTPGSEIINVDSDKCHKGLQVTEKYGALQKKKKLEVLIIKMYKKNRKCRHSGRYVGKG